MKQLKILCDRCGNEIKTLRRIDVQDYVEVPGRHRGKEERYMTHTFRSTLRMELCDDCYERLLAFMNLRGAM